VAFGQTARLPVAGYTNGMASLEPWFRETESNLTPEVAENQPQAWCTLAAMSKLGRPHPKFVHALPDYSCLVAQPTHLLVGSRGLTAYREWTGNLTPRCLPTRCLTHGDFPTVILLGKTLA
jgi:hypothetical protein